MHRKQHSLIFKRVPIWECLVGTLFACIFRDRSQGKVAWLGRCGIATSGRVGQRKMEASRAGTRNYKRFVVLSNQNAVPFPHVAVHPFIPSGNDILLLPRSTGVAHDRTLDYALETWVCDPRTWPKYNIAGGKMHATTTAGNGFPECGRMTASSGKHLQI